MAHVTANKGTQHGAAAAEHQKADATQQKAAAATAHTVAPTPEAGKDAKRGGKAKTSR